MLTPRRKVGFDPRIFLLLGDSGFFFIIHETASEITELIHIGV